MSKMHNLRLHCLLILFASASASPVRDFRTCPDSPSYPRIYSPAHLLTPSAIFNTTTSASVTSTQTTTFTNTHTEPPSFRPHLEVSVLGFEDASTPVARGSQILPSTPALLTSILIRIEFTTTGFVNRTIAQPRPTPDPEADSPYSSKRKSTNILRPHLESTATGFGLEDGSATTGAAATPRLRFTSGSGDEPRITPPPVAIAPPIITVGDKGDTLRPVVVTSVVIDTITLRPGGETAILGEGASATRIFLDTSGHPVVIIGGSSSTVQIPTTIGGKELLPGGAPITIGSGFDVSTISINEAGETIAVVEGQTKTLQLGTTQAFTFNGILATAIANEYEYVVGSSTLSFGQPTTIDGTVVALTTDVSGSTVLINGDNTTPVPALAPAPTRTLADTILEDLSITVISGTTQYLLNSQTLAPDHPITVNGTIISITTTSGTTMLIVGDKTTTLEATATQSSIFGGITPAATPSVVGNGQGKTKASSSTSGAMKVTSKVCSVLIVTLCGIIGIVELG
jgi:hypothetical protein